MAREPRVAAHLGRPETPEEAAARKSENSLNYRRSKTIKNLVFALALTLGVVAVVIWGVPRGDLPAAPEIDVAAVAEQAATPDDRPVIVPEIPAGWRTGDPLTDTWRANVAQLESGNPTVWSIVYAGDDGFLRLEQAFAADEAWVVRTLGGASTAETRSIEGVSWDVYEISRAADNAEVAYSSALGTRAGDDYVLLNGSATREMTEQLAALVADQVRALQTTSTEEER